MFKKALVIIVTLFTVFVLTSCEYFNTQSAYDTWRASDLAEDMNGDRKIDESDYNLYLEQIEYIEWSTSNVAEDINEDGEINQDDYNLYLIVLDFETWKASDSAEDLNGDRKIDENDYELYLNPPTTDYEIWKNSDGAKDLNNDSIINEDDYTIYLEFNEFVGVYHIENYEYSGIRMYFGNKIYLSDLENHLSLVTLNVNSSGEIFVDLPNSTITAFGDDFAIMLEGLNNMRLSKISPYLVGLDTHVTIEGVEVSLSLYLNYTDEGFSTSYTLSIADAEGTIKFDLVRENENEIPTISNEFFGTYSVTNYVYIGDQNLYAGDHIYFSEMGLYLETISFVVDNDGTIDVIIPADKISEFGDQFSIILEGLDNMTLNRISPYIVVLDTTVSFENEQLYFTAYLTEIENGFSTSYHFIYSNLEGTLSFNLVRD